ncbi:MAG: hypothetical protein MIO90_04450 [Methanomassiliicoccales archaeon]|nr:hypothetical protein [Methanomassiliicoccales archaeon]
MKAVVIFDSVSNAKLTAKVAETIATSLRAKGIDVSSVPVQDAKHIDVEEYDLLVLGSPTMAWAPTKDVKDFLESMKNKKFAGKKAATFDTQIRSKISGDGNKAMVAKLKGSGYTIASPSLKTYVRSTKGAYEILDGELEKAGKWGEDLAGSVTK